MNLAVDVDWRIVWRRERFNGDADEDEGQVQLPPSTRTFAFQTAGHVFGQGKSKAGILLHDDKSLLKLVLDPERAERERKFYATVFDATCRDPIILSLRAFIPRYLGVYSTCVSSQDVPFLKLENLTLNFRKPSIMDVKIGFITYDPEASAEKIKRSKDKYFTTKTKGYCIPGMKVYNKACRQYEVYDKTFGKQLTDRTIKEAIIKYLGGRSHVDPKVVKVFLHQLHRIRKWFTMQQQFAFYSSSLLFIYESDDTAAESTAATTTATATSFRFHKSESESVTRRKSPTSRWRGTTVSHHRSVGGGDGGHVDGLEGEMTAKPCRCSSVAACSCVLTSGDEIANDVFALPTTAELRMIDFAHVFPATEIDRNYLSGLDSLIGTFCEISNELDQFKFYTL